MSAFLNDLSSFYGTGDKNEAGQTLEEFLESYDPNKYPGPSCTTDSVVFRTEEIFTSVEQLELLLIKRKNHPCIGCWALPGGFANMRENLDETARRELEEETGVTGLRVEQLATYGNYDRDPRTRVITTAYMSLIEGKKQHVTGKDDAADACWCRVKLEKIDETMQEDGALSVCYCLSLKNREKNIHIKAIVEHFMRPGVIREEFYRVLDQGQTAADHAAIIVQAIIVLNKRIQK